MKALLFDVQGTATDFHTTVRDAAAAMLGPRFPHRDWSAFVNDWRAAYFDALSGLVPSAEGWTGVGSVYRSALDVLLARGGMDDVSAAERTELNRAWRRLKPWPDTVPGLRRLRAKFTLATLSNADVSAVVEITRHGDLPWHAIFTAEMAGAFKPDPRPYLMAARYLGAGPDDIMMVASHKYDLRAARELGFATAFVARPWEYGDPALADVEPSDEFVVNAADFEDLATQLRA
ncbi:MAG: haloacid dehalogenase type II [Mycobacteriaceae bacterium]|nr:haloacid dehalogenase type II [Mycobacteriaceae bacterium]